LQLFEVENRFEFQARRDPLTSLPIRPAVVDRLGECFAREARNPERKFGLCVLNLDGFQNVNERLGHAKGDLLLQTVAERLRHSCRRTDMVARLGGDEFVILLDETPTRRHADSGAERLAELACAAADLDGAALQFSASFGVVWSGAGYESEESMLAAAHKQMQVAKMRYYTVSQAASQREDAAVQEGEALPSMA
jgi:diguanylate cyclase (GGDEF)-like protein